MRLNLYALAAVAGATMFAMPLAEARAATLDGKAFVADLGEKGKAPDAKDDVITFKEGNFHSAACDQFGYSQGGYTATPQGDAIAFEAQTQSEKDGRLTWKGTVRGDTIEGTFVHYRKGWMLNPNPEPIEHWFKGKVKS
jgi:hypothetical protein